MNAQIDSLVSTIAAWENLLDELAARRPADDRIAAIRSLVRDLRVLLRVALAAEQYAFAAISRLFAVLTHSETPTPRPRVRVDHSRVSSPAERARLNLGPRPPHREPALVVTAG
jgi:hypothetical protein